MAKGSPGSAFSARNILSLTAQQNVAYDRRTMKLATYLSKHELSAREFSERLGVSAEAVRLYLSGARHPSPKVMRTIHEATNGDVMPNDFMDVAHPSDAAA